MNILPLYAAGQNGMVHLPSVQQRLDALQRRRYAGQKVGAAILYLHQPVLGLKMIVWTQDSLSEGEIDLMVKTSSEQPELTIKREGGLAWIISDGVYTLYGVPIPQSPGKPWAFILQGNSIPRSSVVLDPISHGDLRYLELLLGRLQYLGVPEDQAERLVQVAGPLIAKYPSKVKAR